MLFDGFIQNVWNLLFIFVQWILYTVENLRLVLYDVWLQLLSVCPTPNSLALVYRDTETLKFVKHINSRVKDTPNQGFMDISCVYYE